VKKLFFILLLFVGKSLFAQEKPELFLEFKNNNRQQRIFYGGRILGLNATQIEGDGYSGYDKVGFMGGAGVSFFIKENWAINLQILYSRKGSVNRNTADDPYVGTVFSDYIAKVNVIELPLSFEYYHNRWVFNAGGAFNILINESEEFGYYPQNDRYVPPAFQRFTADALLGLKYNLFSKIYVFAKFQYGITPMRRVENTPLQVNYGVHQLNNQLSFGIQYLF